MSVFAQVAEIVGAEGRDALIAAYGGRRLHVPREIRPDAALARAVGFDAARAVAQVFGGENISVPMSLRRPADLGERILALSDEGLSAGEIARRLNVNERTVYRWRARRSNGV